MRNLILLFALTIITACQTSSSNRDKSLENQMVDVQMNFKAILNGDWFEPSYIDDLAKTKSPYRSQNALSSIVELNIDTTRIRGDSLEIGSPSIPRRNKFFIFFRPGIKTNSFPTTLKDDDSESNLYELGYLISGKDTSVVIYHYDKNKKLLGENEYKKVPKNSEGALQYMVNKTLVAGVYKTNDTTGKYITIQLTNDGKIIGLPNFTTYYVLTDFVAGPQNKLDEICFNIQTNNQECYAFEIKGDTINFYEPIENEDHITLRLGQLKYKLVKQNQKSVENKFEQRSAAIPGDTVCEIGKNIRCIFQDAKNNFWFATNGEGVFKYDGKTIIQFTDKHGLCSNFVWTVQEDKNGNMWFRAGDAICYFDGKKFMTMQTDGNAFQQTNFNYHQKELLVEQYYDGQSLAKIQLPQTSPIKNANGSRFHYDIYCTYKDKSGNLWFGTAGAGVCKYDGKTYTWLDNIELSAPVRSIFEDKNGAIWIGNNGYGLFRYDGKTVTNFTKEWNLGNPDFIKTLKGKEGTLARVWTITADKLGHLWIGTIDAGVWMFDGKTVVNYTTKDGLNSNSICTIYKDKKDNLWFGTDNAGVYTFDGKMFKKFAVKK